MAGLEAENLIGCGEPQGPNDSVLKLASRALVGKIEAI